MLFEKPKSEGGILEGIKVKQTCLFVLHFIETVPIQRAYISSSCLGNAVLTNKNKLSECLPSENMCLHDSGT